MSSRTFTTETKIDVTVQVTGAERIMALVLDGEVFLLTRADAQQMAAALNKTAKDMP